MQNFMSNLNMKYSQAITYIILTILMSMGYVSAEEEDSSTASDSEVKESISAAEEKNSIEDKCCKDDKCATEDVSCTECNFYCKNGFICGELLFLRAFEGGLCGCCGPTHIEDFVGPNGEFDSIIRSKAERTHFNWDVGYRVGAGFEFSDCWNVEAYWLQFHSHAKGHNRHRFRWNLDLNLLDVLVGREFSSKSCFSWMPFIGIRCANIDQKVRSRFVTTTTFLNTVSLFTNHDRNKEKFSGVGPLIGIEGEWNLGCGFSVYGCGAIGVLFGRYNVRFRSFDVSTLGTTSCHRRNRCDACQAVTEAEIGIQWETCFCSDYLLTLGVGLEHMRFFDHNRIGCYGDLCLDGVTFKAGVGF